MQRSRAAARRLIIRRLLERESIASQEELLASLERQGHRVTQTTVSRDLAALGAEKVGIAGGARYRLPPASGEAGSESDLARRLREFAVGIEASGNLALVRTLPGAANSVAAALDAMHLDGVLGTLAGDDTLIIVGRFPDGGDQVAGRLTDILESGR